MGGIAVSTLTLFLLLLPGIFFNKFFFSGNAAKKNKKISAFDDFIRGIIPGVVAQLLGVLFVNTVKPFGYFAELKILGQLFYTTNDQNQPAFDNIQKYLGAIILYNFIIIVLAALAGYIFRLIIIQSKLMHYPFFGYDNDMNYFLSGERYQWEFAVKTKKENHLRKIREKVGLIEKKRKRSGGDINFRESLELLFLNFRIKKILSDITPNSVLLFVVVRSDDKESYIYKGVYYRAFYTNEGVLDSLILHSARRRKFKDDYLNTDKYYKLSSNFVLLKNSEIININVVYGNRENL